MPRSRKHKKVKRRSSKSSRTPMKRSTKGGRRMNKAARFKSETKSVREAIRKADGDLTFEEVKEKFDAEMEAEDAG